MNLELIFYHETSMKSRPSLSFYRRPSYPVMSQASDLAQAPAFNEKIIALKTGSIDAAIARDTHVLSLSRAKAKPSISSLWTTSLVAATMDSTIGEILPIGTG